MENESNVFPVSPCITIVVVLAEPETEWPSHARRNLVSKSCSDSSLVELIHGGVPLSPRENSAVISLWLSSS